MNYKLHLAMYGLFLVAGLLFMNEANADTLYCVSVPSEIKGKLEPGPGIIQKFVSKEDGVFLFSYNACVVRLD